jgi:alkaline phosphatase D
VKFKKHPEGGRVNVPPTEGLQFFGEVKIDGRTEAMTVSLKDVAGATLFKQELAPQRL